jgi:hypothetical protein
MCSSSTKGIYLLPLATSSDARMGGLHAVAAAASQQAAAKKFFARSFIIRLQRHMLVSK